MLTYLKYTKTLKIAVCLFIAITAVFLLANFVLAAAGPDLGLDKAAGTGLSASQDIRVIIAKIIRIIIGFLGIIAVGLIMYAGWLWMTSQGNEEKIEQAKRILTNAVIGLIIILSSFAIVSFILNKLVEAGIGGPGGGPGDGPGGGGGGISALGSGIIESHYPARDQKDVPRNTSVIITFREPLLAKTLCKTADTAKEAKCNGEDINEKVIRIFMKDEAAKCAVDYSASPGCASLAGAKVYTSADGKNYVFALKNYLGSPNEPVEYSVYLGAGLLRQSGEKAFPGMEQDYGWSFEVSTIIDLTPPQVKRGEVKPAPDNLRDTSAPVSAAKPAGGSITISSNPLIYSDAAALSVNKPADAAWSEAAAAVSKDCERNGEFKVNVDAGEAGIIKLTDSNDILLGQGTVSGQTVSFSLCNLKLTVDSGDFVAGNLWTVNLKAATAADTVTVGNTTYIAATSESGANFKIGSTEEETAESLANVLTNNPEVTANRAGKVIKLTAKIAGAAGNNIILSNSNPTALAVSLMSGGSDKENNITINGKKDQPMNVGLQINFNEAIMPLTVSGSADELKDYIRVVNADAAAKSKNEACAADADCQSFICDNGKCAGDHEYLKGKFAVSNQYSTVEFLSDKECGFNSCGEKIYCLPSNSHLEVKLSAASLIPCAGDNDCQTNSPFNICDEARKFCRDSDNKYFPQADKTKPNIVDGLVDAAFNSLDGNRDGSAYGPVSFYNENIAEEIGSGDNYQWSFFITDQLDLTPPKIKETTPIINGNVPGTDLIKAIKISFDKLMLSSRLTTGSLIIENGKEKILHYLLNLRSFLDQPLGYWITNTGQQSAAGGEIDRTDVYINHTIFNGASTYRVQAGSGLKDIYQNCFLPCSSDSLTGIPSCCNGTPTDRESCP